MTVALLFVTMNLRLRALALLTIALAFCFLPAVAAFACEECGDVGHEVVVRSTARPAERPAEADLLAIGNSIAKPDRAPASTPLAPPVPGDPLPPHPPLRI